MFKFGFSHGEGHRYYKSETIVDPGFKTVV